MKILLIYTLYLISGPGSCFDVSGYSGGSVIINSDVWWSSDFFKYISKMNPHKCMNAVPPLTSGECVHDQRFRLYKEGIRGRLVVLIRGLNPLDAGDYRIGVGSLYRDMKLKIISDSCCGRSESQNGSRGETITLRYPDQFQNQSKYIIKLDHSSYSIINTESNRWRGRFSISEDSESGVVSVRISDVREDDGGVYACAVWNSKGSMGYFSLFHAIHLQITEKTSTAPPAPTTVLMYEESSNSSFIIIITVSICVVLLLIVGLTLIFYYMLRQKSQGSADSSGMELNDNKQVPPVICVYEEIKPTDLPESETGVYANASTTTPSKDQDLTYCTVSFHKNPGSPTDDTSVRVSKEEPDTEYATIKYPTGLE